MAGKRQHHVWQMLQRGFSWKENNDHHIWVYRNGFAPEQTVTRKFGRLNSFFGSAGSSADENITDFENATQGFIQDARRMADGQSISTDTAAALVSHLEMRSLFLRDEVSRLGERMVRFIRDCLASPKQYQAIMSAYFRNHPELIDAKIEEADIPDSMRPLIRDLIEQAAPKMIRDYAPEMAAFADLLHTTIATSMADIAKNAHNEALVTNFSQTKRTEFHRSLQFSVIRSIHAEFILPDTSIAFFARNGMLTFFTKGRKSGGGDHSFVV